MARILVGPLAHVPGLLNASGAQSVVSLLTPRAPRPDWSVARHLHIAVSDTVLQQENHVLADAGHMERLLRFIFEWDLRAPLLIHCYAGVSRSTAAAFIAICALDPAGNEQDHATALRTASPTATPNPHLVRLADAALGREGRMSTAIAAIGRGIDCYEGNCFTLELLERETGAPRAPLV